MSDDAEYALTEDGQILPAAAWTEAQVCQEITRVVGAPASAVEVLSVGYDGAGELRTTVRIRLVEVFPRFER